MLRPILLSTALALTTPPAQAENVISLQLTPRNMQEADLLRLGLALYAIDRGLRSGASIEQIGQDNAAEIAQGGAGNFGLIRQSGRDHLANLTQPGSSGAFAIFQSGKGATAQIVAPSSGIILQYGW